MDSIDPTQFQENLGNQPERQRPHPVFTSEGLIPMYGSHAADIVLLFYGLGMIFFDIKSLVSVAQQKVECLISAADELHDVIINMMSSEHWTYHLPGSPGNGDEFLVDVRLIDALIRKIPEERWFEIWRNRTGSYAYWLTNGDMPECHPDGWTGHGYDDLIARRAWIEYAVAHALTARMTHRTKLGFLLGWHIEDNRKVHFFKYQEKNRQV